MRQADIQGTCRGRRNLVSAATEEDLVKRQFTAQAPDRLWLTDATEHPTCEEDCTARRSWTPFQADYRMVD
jgi:putative transposase